jgi:hypothetical protein
MPRAYAFDSGADSHLEMGHDQLRRGLILVLVLPLLARVTGHFGFRTGEIGAYAVTFFVLPVCSMAIVVFSIRQFILRIRHGATVPVLKWGLLFVALLGFLLAIEVLPHGSNSSTAAALVAILSVIWLVALAILDTTEGRGDGPPREGL